MKIKTTIHIHYSQYPWDQAGEYLAFYGKLDDNDHRTYVCSQEIEIEVPDNYDPRPAKIAALEAQRAKAAADYQQTVTEINRRISELQAIEYTA